MTPGFIFYLLLLLNAAPNEVEIPYDANRPLVWEDFKQRAANKSLFKAYSYTGIRYVVDAPDGKHVEIETLPYFVPDKSWVNKDFKNEYLLNHEQRHFDLTAIHAQILDSLLRPYETEVSRFMDDNLIKGVEQIFDDVYAQLEEAQAQYDKETEHSIQRDKQEEWDAKIDSLKRAHLPL